MQSSKQESKYRIKFIQEHHYNKFEQKQFDEAKDKLGMSYKVLYLSVKWGAIWGFMSAISIRRAIRAMSKVSMSAEQATDCVSSLGRALSQYKALKGRNTKK